MMKTGNDFYGEPTWIFLHTLCANYEPAKKDKYLQFLYLFGELYFCPICSDHFRENMKKLPPEKYMNNAEDLFSWSYIMHDLVNQYKLKNNIEGAEKSPPYEEVKKKYFYAVGKSEVTNTTPLSYIRRHPRSKNYIPPPVVVQPKPILQATTPIEKSLPLPQEKTFQATTPIATTKPAVPVKRAGGGCRRCGMRG